MTAGPTARPAEHDNLIRDDITVRLAGESGEGVISSGDILTTGAARTGYWALTFRTYPAEIKGGPCMYQVRVGVDAVRSQGDAVDLLICFNQEAFDLHHHELADGRAHRLRRRVGEGHAAVRVALVRGPAGHDRAGGGRQPARQEHGRRSASSAACSGSTRADRGDDPQALRPQGRRRRVEHQVAAGGLRARARQAPGRRAQARPGRSADEDRGAALGQPGDLPGRPARWASATTPATRSRPPPTSSSGWPRACRASAASRSRPRTRSPRSRPCWARRLRAARR